MGVCALVAASDFNASYFQQRFQSGAFAHIVAVDAGYSHLEALGVRPHTVLGDFDSLGFVPAAENLVRYPSHKDKSDLELAFDFALENGFSSVEVYGALGGRVDHTLANLQLFARFAEAGMQVVVCGNDSALRVLVGPATFELPSVSAGTVSVFSAGDCAYGVTESGLEYPLENAQLSNRTSLGLSNELKGKSASVSVQKGTLYVFYPLA